MQPPAGVGRVGVGYDLHRLVDGRPLVLGGVTMPAERGALGHSDADVICHAVTDAMLGAARAGDIGQHYPDTDPRWKGASSIELLKEVAGLVRSRGLRVENVDVVVILERPKIGPHREAIQARLAEALGHRRRPSQREGQDQRRSRRGRTRRSDRRPRSRAADVRATDDRRLPTAD